MKMEIENKCPCLKICCDNPEIYHEPEDPDDEDSYCGISICENCDASCNCEM